jgi:hypothetical protein
MSKVQAKVPAEKPRKKHGGMRAGSGPQPKIPKRLSGLLAAIDFRDYCRSHAHKIIDRFMKIVETSDDPFAVIAAGNAVMNRAFGKPKETFLVEQAQASEQTKIPSFDELRSELMSRGMKVIDLQPSAVHESACHLPSGRCRPADE